MAISQRMQNVNYRLLTYLLPIPILVFYALSLTGCISNSPGIPNIFTLKISTNAGLELRLGYYGMCVYKANEFICQPTSGKNTDAIKKQFSPVFVNNGTHAGQTSDLIELAHTLQTSYLLGILAVAGNFFAISLIFLALLKRDFHMTAKNNASYQRRERLRQATMVTLWVSVAFVLAAAVSIEQTLNALVFVSPVNLATTGIKITAGKGLDVLQWLAFGFSVVFAFGVSLMFRKEGGTIQSAGLADTSAPSLAAAPPPPPPVGALPPPPPPPPAAW